MFTSKTFLRTFTVLAVPVLAVAAGLAACDEIQAPKPKHKPVVTAPRPLPAPEPTPPIPAPPTPPPVATTPIAESDKSGDKTGVGEKKSDEDIAPTDVLGRARKALDEGDVDRAFELAKQAVAKSPKRSGAWNLLGRVELQMGKRKEALASFEKAIELNPTNSFAHNNLGLTLIYEKRYDEAVDALEEAVELEPVESFMWNNLGMAYEHLDRLDEAREAYGKSVEMENGRAKENLARLEGVKSLVRTAKVDIAVKPAESTPVEK